MSKGLRMNYYRIAQEKYKKAVRVIKFLRYAPGVKMIAVANSVSQNLAAPASDIDLFIVTRSGSVWTARFFCIMIVSLFGKRPLRPGVKGNGMEPAKSLRNKDKICLTFFLSEDNLDLEKYKIAARDVYLMRWIRAIKPLYSENAIDTEFYHQNGFAFQGKEEITRAPFIPNYKRRIRQSFFLKPLVNYFSIGEPFYKWLQLKIMPLPLKMGAFAWDSAVIVSDKILKFHTNDRRLEYNRTYAFGALLR